MLTHEAVAFPHLLALSAGKPCLCMLAATDTLWAPMVKISREQEPGAASGDLASVMLISSQAVAREDPSASLG